MKTILDKTTKTNRRNRCRSIWPFASALAMAVIVAALPRPALASSIADASGPVPTAAMKLVEFCADHRAGFDAQAAATVVDYVLESKASKEGALPTYQNATGVYYEYDARSNFPNFLQYSYNSRIPSVLMNPASVRYSVWSDASGDPQKLPGTWKLPSPADRPTIVHGSEREGITPDLTTGVYYEYGLKRTLILMNHKGKLALISIAKQTGTSDVGKKGFILGNDSDWNYYYSGEPGSAMSGLGWVKSYIYSFFTVAVYVEPSPSSHVVRSGNFQWIRAGWSGVNFVKKEHVIKGMKRRAAVLRTILESPNLPAASRIFSTRQQLLAASRQELTEKYASLQQARHAMAVRTGKIKANDAAKLDGNIPKEQMVEELMVEYLKTALGKPSLLTKKVAMGGE